MQKENHSVFAIAGTYVDTVAMAVLATGTVLMQMGALAINLALLAGLPEVTKYEVPMLWLAGALPPWVTAAYAVVLWAEVYTTAVSSLFGLAVRFVPGGNPARYRLVTVAAGVGALGVSEIGWQLTTGDFRPLRLQGSFRFWRVRLTGRRPHAVL